MSDLKSDALPIMLIRLNNLELWRGLEPRKNDSFADCCLTIWLPEPFTYRRQEDSDLQDICMSRPFQDRRLPISVCLQSLKTEEGRFERPNPLWDAASRVLWITNYPTLP